MCLYTGQQSLAFRGYQSLHWGVGAASALAMGLCVQELEDMLDMI